MLISVPAFRRCMLLALMLASLIALADGVVRAQLVSAVATLQDGKLPSSLMRVAGTTE